MNKLIKWHKLLSLFIVVSTVFLCAFTSFRNEQGITNANVVHSKTPVDSSGSGAIWSLSFLKNGSTSYNSIPILTDNYIYIVNENVLYELSYKGNITRKITLCTKMNSVCNMLLEKNFLYIPLNKGIVECIDISSMKSKWQSKAFQGQSLSTLFFHQGKLYTGCTEISSQGTTGVFYCVDCDNGSIVWTYEDKESPGGYYWSGAIVHDNTLFFAGDNGRIISHSLYTNEIYDSYCLSMNSKIRSGITYDQQTDSLYTVSTDGKIYKIKTKNHKFTTVTSSYLIKNPGYVNCTSTPTVYQGRIYTGLISNRLGIVSVMDAHSMTPLYEVQGSPNMEIKSSPLVSTRGKKNGMVSIYVTGNGFPGGIYYFMDSPSTTQSTMKTLFIPPKNLQQFCISSITAGTDGTLYYSNDSGTLFAIRDGVKNTSPSTQTKPSPSATSRQKNTKPKKPKEIKVYCKKNKIRITWKKQTKNSQSVLSYQYGKGKKKTITVKTKNSVTLKRKKKLHFRIRCRLKKNHTWYYSNYTKTFFVP